MLENWLSYACLYINCHSKKLLGVQKNFLYITTHHKISLWMMQYSKVAVHRQLEQKASKGKGSSF